MRQKVDQNHAFASEMSFNAHGNVYCLVQNVSFVVVFFQCLVHSANIVSSRHDDFVSMFSLLLYSTVKKNRMEKKQAAEIRL